MLIDVSALCHISLHQHEMSRPRIALDWSLSLWAC
jgi:hypothetical protein